MCGIVGQVDYSSDLRDSRNAVLAMARTMANRGPDDEGTWTSRRAALGHRRLAVIDLAGGKQPMARGQEDGPAVALTFSGEIYNYRELRAQLVDLGHEFRTVSDTEVLVHAYLQWGKAVAGRLNGMFAFAIWDGRSDELVLCRDRLGIKPLYYTPTASGVIFGSEAKALFAGDGIRPMLDLDGLRELLLNASLVRRPGHAVFQGIREVEPGCLVTVAASGITEQRYWDVEAQPHCDDQASTIARVRSLLEDIVERQLVADVPVCVLLSGGLDSSTLTALAGRALHRHGRSRVRSIGLTYEAQADGRSTDALRTTLDDPYILLMSDHVGTSHTDVRITSDDLTRTDTIRACTGARDLPYLGNFDASLYLLSKATREHATVALSGEGADEFFAGYPWFHEPFDPDDQQLPWLAIQGFGSEHTIFSPALVDRLDMPGTRRSLCRAAFDSAPVADGLSDAERCTRQMTYLHLKHHLPALLDRKDRLSMAAGLEIRVPFCDHRLVEYLYNIPWSLKTFDGREKSLLRAAARDLLPSAVANRKKSAFPLMRHPGYAASLGQAVGEILRTAGPVTPLLDITTVRGLIEHVDQADVARLHSLEFLLALNTWLQEYAVEVHI
ncbi:asparagine synthase (glutamine-hydrolyzing) [Streptomyces sp. NPDC050658]|uniref:asparagine synthase (glutamine-hydrolyzing) n=1 Tax=unclassified Streptomyces TaxID=2593676 RepID=UPI003436F2AD